MIRKRDYQNIFEEVLHMSTDGFLLADPAGIIVEINEPYAAFFGRTREEIIGLPISELIPYTEFRKIMAGEPVEQNSVHNFVHGTAGEDFAIVSRSRVTDADGNPVAFVSQVKFREHTLRSVKKPMREYSEPECCREAQGEQVCEVTGSSPDPEGIKGRTLREMMNKYEKKVLLDLLKRCGYNYSQAAKEAGIHRSLLYKKMAKYRMR